MRCCLSVSSNEDVVLAMNCMDKMLRKRRQVQYTTMYVLHRSSSIIPIHSFSLEYAPCDLCFVVLTCAGVSTEGVGVCEEIEQCQSPANAWSLSGSAQYCPQVYASE